MALTQENMICQHFELKSTVTFRQTPHAVQAVLVGSTDTPPVYQRPWGQLISIFMETLKTFRMYQKAVGVLVGFFDGCWLGFVLFF